MSSRYRRTKKRRAGNYPSNRLSYWDKKRAYIAAKAQERLEANQTSDLLDLSFGYERFNEGVSSRLGWCFNMRTTSLSEEGSGNELSAVDFYFVQPDGGTFKAAVVYEPYFLLQLAPSRGSANLSAPSSGASGASSTSSGATLQELESFFHRRYEGLIAGLEMVEKEDLDLPNHLSGLRSRFVKLRFRSVQELMAVRRDIMPVVEKNKRRRATSGAYSSNGGVGDSGGRNVDVPAARAALQQMQNLMDQFIDIREYDVPYVQRVCIDKELRVGQWFRVTPRSDHRGVDMEVVEDMTDRPLLRVLVYDIETTKMPLKFPDATIDAVMMISYMIDGQGYLIVNREIVSEDIADFEYTPKPEYPGHFIVFNERDERATLQRFFNHIRAARPHIVVTYNGDFFDWPFVDARATHHGIDMAAEIGVWRDERSKEYKGRFTVHMDAFCWVQRDSYLPQGSQGLKAVTKAKLKYDPLELDPEEMLPFAQSKPHVLAAYSVSDAVCTYYLYMKYVHNFIFSLCTIIPMPPSDVLRKGSGTLCELLLMVQAYRGNIVCPNKIQAKPIDYHDGHLLESETYIGGHVECLESGIYREDFPYKFRMNPDTLQGLIDKVDRTLEFAIAVEAGKKMEDVLNLDEVASGIKGTLAQLRDEPNIETLPLIYHLDVGAMYPNIILTNRLQPMAIVDQATCAACDFNSPENMCKREMDWVWRGKYFPASRSEVHAMQQQLEHESIDGDALAKEHSLYSTPTSFGDLPLAVRAAQLKARVKTYSHKVYKKYTVSETQSRDATICQRENPFYVDTVRSFRDRRYTYKGLVKTWKKKLDKAGNAVEVQKAKDMVLLYDSLQLAHKCILNSFYGYVMRRGARWHSMEMAGVVTKTGADIIKEARILVENIGRPLELDTDGIWCMLPGTFPENYEVKLRDGSSLTVSYPCSMLNIDVNDNCRNDQYQVLEDPATHRYSMNSEMTIYFEVDGPYRAMVLPASQEEGKNIKKRYAVFNQDGSLAELKGFEIKRRGELKLIKIFQGQVFSLFLKGDNIQQCYDAVGAAANHWFDILYSHGEDLDDEDLFDLISESKNMTKSLADYGDSKSTAITTARRLGEFLGADMVKDKGLQCRFIIAQKPYGASVSQRAVPIAIFSAQDAVRKHFLRRWLKDQSLTTFDIRDLLDWEYYISRLSSAVRKIITIPAAFQGIDNPVPRCQHPDWLLKRIRSEQDGMKQLSMVDFFKAKPKKADGDDVDMEDIGGGGASSSGVAAARATRRKHLALGEDDGDDGDDDGGEDDGPLPDAAVRKEDAADAENEAEFLSQGDKASSPEEAKALALVKKKQRETAPVLSEVGVEAWLSYHKTRWRDMHKRRKRQREEERRMGSFAKLGMGVPGGAGAGSGARGPSNLGVLLHRQHKFIQQHYWQVVQFAPDPLRPGLFRVWAFLERNTLRSVLVRVPRVVYVNLRSIEPGAGSAFDAIHGAELLHGGRTLPHGRQSRYLHRLKMSEDRWLRTSKSLDEFLHRPDVEGVYESQVPLSLRLLTEVGCVCKVNASKIDPSGEYSQDALIMGNTTELPYLEDVDFRRVYFYHSMSDTRGLFVLVFEHNVTRLRSRGGQAAMRDEDEDDEEEEEEEPRFEMYVVVVNPYQSRLEKVSMGRLLDTVAGETGDPSFSRASLIKSTQREVRSASRAWSAMSKRLAQFTKSEMMGATIMLAQTHVPVDEVTQRLKLHGAMPVITVPSVRADNRYEPFNWHLEACKVALHRYFSSQPWLEEALSVCRFGHLPIGNLEADHSLQVLDVMYARNLQRANHLLWVSPSSRADLGGFEEDENFFASEHANPEIVSPGCWRSVCTSIGISDIHLAALMNSQLIEQLEGVDGEGVSVPAPAPASGGERNGSGASASDTLLSSLKDLDSAEASASSESCAEAFSVLKRMANLIVSTKHSAPDSFAAHLAPDIYRWLRSSSSMLYDAALHRTLHRLVCKLFFQLVSRFRALGSTVVYATFNMLIIATGRTSAERAMSYIQFVSDTVSSRPEFGFLGLQVDNLYGTLLFLDQTNFAAMDLEVVLDRPREERLRLDLVEDARQEAEGAVAVEDDGDVAMAGGGSDSDSDEDGDIVDPRERARRRRERALQEDETQSTQLDTLEMDEDEDEDDTERYFKEMQRRDAMLKNALEGKVVDEDEAVLDEDEDTPMGEAMTLKQREAEEEARLGLRKEAWRAPRHLREQYTKHWDIARYLPELAERGFEEVMFEFVARPYARLRAMIAREELALLDGQKTNGDHAMASSGVDHAAQQRRNAEFAEWLREFVSQSIATDLLRRASSIHRRLRPDSRVAATGHKAGDAFPERPGSHLPLRDPALEFIKSMMHVMRLDATVEEPLAVLRTNLLRLIDVRPFSSEAQFKNPCLTFVLPDFFCESCLTPTDLDLCRDPTLEGEQWPCPGCQDDLDKSRVECLLIDILQRRVTSYQVRDLVCNRCNRVKTDNMSEYCACSGHFVTADSRHAFMMNLLVFDNVARFHGFELLAEMTRFLRAGGV